MMSKERLEQLKGLPDDIRLEGCHDLADQAQELIAEVERLQIFEAATFAILAPNGVTGGVGEKIPGVER